MPSIPGSPSVDQATSCRAASAASTRGSVLCHVHGGAQQGPQHGQALPAVRLSRRSDGWRPGVPGRHLRRLGGTLRPRRPPAAVRPLTVAAAGPTPGLAAVMDPPEFDQPPDQGKAEPARPGHGPYLGPIWP